jgi:ubiquinone/menaquinone biosynthesis C-methylase UbiE
MADAVAPDTYSRVRIGEMTEMQVNDPVMEHNLKAAAMWSQGGRAYDTISSGISEGIRHGVMRLAPEAGQDVLDIATGTGWTARQVAKMGAKVTGVDIADGLLSAARELATEEGVSVEWRLGDAEKLPLADASFDAAISTFGIMFASNQEAALRELSRVVRPGGRIAVVAWEPGTNAAALRQVVARFMPQAPAPKTPPPSPFNWGDPDWLLSALGDHFDLRHEKGELFHRLGSPSEAWTVYSSGFPPVQAVAGALAPERRAEMRAAFEDWVGTYRTDLGVAIPFQYLVTIGIRR